MSGKNQYNVLVDMEDETVYNQPATIESDGLEFQDFTSSSNAGSSAKAPPPPPSANNINYFDTQQQTSPRSNKPLWSLDYYAQFFDVDTTQVLERCLKSLYPVGDFASDTLNNQPDLYGPFWIATTVVFAVFVCSSLAGSLAAYMNDATHVYDFRLLSYAVFVIYTYSFVSPVLVWASTKYYGCQPNLLEIIDFYGYSLTIWIPVSVLCVMPFDIARWVFVSIAFALTAFFLTKNLYMVISRADAKTSRFILLAILLAHAIFALVLKVAFYSYDFRNTSKSEVPPPDFSKVIDVLYPEQHEQLVEVTLKHELTSLSHLFGDRPTNFSKAYIIKSVPGLIVIPNPFTPQAQRYLIKESLSNYPRPPNISNLDTHYDIDVDGLWQLYEKEEQGILKDYLVPKKATAESDSSDDDTDIDTYEEEPQPQTQTQTCPATACSPSFVPDLSGPKPDPLPAATVPLLKPSELIRKIRWITLGYHYHWPTKTYHFDRRYPVPDDVAELTHAVAVAVEGIGYEGEQPWRNTYRGADFRAQAGVVNYYQYRDALMGHVDRSELNMEAPLISLSLGNACIYLIGGETRDTEPVALHLRSGDIVVMTEACRKAFHGVPRILEDTLPDYLSPAATYPDAPNWKLFGTYISTSRININIRQVYKEHSST
ncbi:uncharacterized protein BYT42DRAFT_602653 [Radiomyces spectabilis]|uniref:uncharacterized protein n=1 Tax=Radiomyces spectabilis TaxID=64574 RepID=UPI00221F3282|nr:uncharacterized protein BYT42DRAFT_602653 [Radiomyces spectabilis]KAI8388032.1 hypothetical protein BYT42DRAFT_602653 [Radiomyces spectabilis]